MVAIAASAASHDRVEIQARHVWFYPDQSLLMAQGDLSIEVHLLKIRASSLVFNLKKGTIKLHDPLIREHGGVIVKGRSLFLHSYARTLVIDEPQIIGIPQDKMLSIFVTGKNAKCENDRCIVTEARATACPHHPIGYEILARKTTIHPSGDIDLLRPVLYIGGTPVMALPWLRLRPPNTAGFLSPRLGWNQRAGLILGPAGFIPIGSSGFVQGHLAIRTSQGLEALADLKTPYLTLKVNHLRDFAENHVRLRAHAMPPLKGSSLVVDADVPTSRQVIDDLTQDPLERALTHTSSRARWTADVLGTALETSFDLIHTFDSSGQLGGRFLSPRTDIAFFLPSTPLAGLIWPNMDLKLTRFDALGSDLGEDCVSSFAPAHSRIQGFIGLDLPADVGPFEFEARAASSHQVWLPDSSRYETTNAHLIAGEIFVSLPLARKFDSVEHTIAPFVRYRITPWRQGQSPFWIMDDFDRLQRGHGIDAGFSTTLHKYRQAPLGSFEIAERLYFKGFDQAAGPAYLRMSIGAGPSWLRFTADGSLDHERLLPSTASFSIALRAPRVLSMEVEARWLGPGRGPHMDAAWQSAGAPFLVSAWPQGQTEVAEISEKIDLKLTRQLKILAGTRIGVWPHPSLNALRYGLELGSACGCLELRLWASHRPETSVPDIMVDFTVAGL
jgi:hypothetical protein